MFLKEVFPFWTPSSSSACSALNYLGDRFIGLLGLCFMSDSSPPSSLITNVWLFPEHKEMFSSNRVVRKLFQSLGKCVWDVLNGSMSFFSKSILCDPFTTLPLYTNVLRAVHPLLPVDNLFKIYLALQLRLGKLFRISFITSSKCWDVGFCAGSCWSRCRVRVTGDISFSPCLVRVKYLCKAHHTS